MMPPRYEPRYLHVRLRRPASAWPLVRLFSVGATLAIVVTLLRWPETGHVVFWDILIALLPLVFLLAPGLWRNACPMAAMNQAPRVLGLAGAVRLPRWLERHGYAIAVVLFMALASSRMLGLGENAVAAALLVSGALVFPFFGGLLFKGKSGFCGSVCPLRPAQGLYGQTPIAQVENSHCKPCVSCVSNCPDLKPGRALRDDLEDETAPRGGYTKLFAGAFPGFILAFYSFPEGAEPTAATVYPRFALYMLVSLGCFFLLEAATRLRPERMVSLFAAVAFNVFYWFSVPHFAEGVASLSGGGEAPVWALWEARAILAGLSLVWLVRTFAKQRASAAGAGTMNDLPMAPVGAGAATAAVPAAAVSTAPAPAAKPRPAPKPRPTAGNPPVPVPDRRSRRRPLRRFQVTLLPEGNRLEADAGQTLAEVVQLSGADLQSGCQMGLCGCDPVYVCDGGENLSAMEADERATVARFGFPEQTRMACVTRVQGDVVISLEAEVAASPAPAAPVPVPLPEPEIIQQPAAVGDGKVGRGGARRALGMRIGRGGANVERVVIIGNGIAGVTTADHIRRHHAECRIDLITEERHPFYNRTSVSRLIHDRAGMQNMYLLPDPWYEERRIVSWLNTGAVRIDRKGQRVELGTGESLHYDRLMLATGASASLPPISNFGLDGCFTLRSADDAMLIREFAQRSDCARAIVVGGGVLGLEAAESLVELGIEATVVERAYGLAPTQLDAASGRILREQLEAGGMEILLGTSVKAVEGRKRVIGVELEGGIRRTADLLLVAAGINPNVALARAAGLKVSRGVQVDDAMRTSDRNIFAAGDVAEHRGRVYGLWPAAVEQAEVAAINAIGAGATYPGSVVPTHLRLGGLELVSIGEPHGNSGDSEILVTDERAPYYRKLILSDDMIVGAILLGDPVEAPAVLAAIREQRDVGADLDALRAGDWEVLNEAPFERAVVAPLSRYRKRDDDVDAAAS
jgi:NADPH-dependent 2,4-dienoyl-CoA reductase/sulfur reductase-like enzyme/ferredoxin